MDAYGPRAPDWATVAGAGVGVIGAGRQNHYNLPSAREAMWRALTMTKLLPNGTLETILPGGNNVGAAAHEAERKAYWATTFRAVGDIVHVVQDMAQPQHTRNDGHAGYGCAPYVGCAFGHDSFVEKYFAARTIQARQFTLKEGLVIPSDGKPIDTTAPQLIYGGYLVPSFASASHYFSTATGAGNAAGKGLANYSNRGFFSFGTNIKGSATSPANPSQYPLPDATILTERTLSGTEVINMTGGLAFTGVGFTAEIKFKEGFVNDALTGAADKIKLSSFGLWDQFLKQKNVLFGDYTLNHYNYDDQARLLIPRAVGYSAGLIDYFFRGEMKIDLPDEGIYSVIDHADPASNCKDTCGFKKIKLKLTNTTPDIVDSVGGATVVQHMATGTFVAVVKFSRNSCYKTDLSGEVGSDDFTNDAAGYSKCLFNNGEGVAGNQVEEIVVSQPQSFSSLDKGQQKPFTFTFDQPIPINSWNMSLQVVYRGPMGDESDAVAVMTKPISAPTYWQVRNDTDYYWVNQKFYTREEIEASDALFRNEIAAECAGMSASGANEIRTACLGKFPIGIRMYSGLPGVAQASHEIAVAEALPFARFVSVAFLSDSNVLPESREEVRWVQNDVPDEYVANFRLPVADLRFNEAQTSIWSWGRVRKSRGSYAPCRSNGVATTISFYANTFDAALASECYFTGFLRIRMIDLVAPRSDPAPVPLTSLNFGDGTVTAKRATQSKTTSRPLGAGRAGLGSAIN